MLPLIALLIIALTIQSSPSNSLTSSSSNVELMDQHKRTMVGGYSRIGPNEAEDLIPIASFALSEFVTSEAALQASFSIVPSQMNEVTPVVLDAQRQVVAGLNYKLTIGLMRNTECLGGFKVTVWKQLSGELNAMNWGEVLECDEIYREFGEVLNAMRVEEEMEGEKIKAEPDT